MVKVMAMGVFDILHLGHIHYLENAKRLGDELIVVIACDKSAAEKKNKPIFNQDERANMISYLRPVDDVVIGYEDDKFRSVEDIRPDIIALGYDQEHYEEDIRKELERRGLKTEVVRMEKSHDSSVARVRKLLRMMKKS